MPGEFRVESQPYPGRQADGVLGRSYDAEYTSRNSDT